MNTIKEILHKKREATEKHIKQLQQEGKQGIRYTAMIPDIPFPEKLKHVVKFIRENVFLRATVKGKSQDNQDVTYKMLNDYDKFDSYDYDDLFTSMTIDSNDINHSLNENNIIIHLLSCFNKNRIHFGLL